MKKGEKMKYTYYQLGIMAAVVSFLGFVVENIWLAMTKGYINNRNMNAPFFTGLWTADSIYVRGVWNTGST